MTIISLIIIAVIIVFFGMLMYDTSAEEQKREKRANEQREREYQEKISRIQPDYIFGSKDSPHFIKDNFWMNNGRKYNLADSFYFYSAKKLLIILTQDKKHNFLLVECADGKDDERDEIIKTLIKYKAKKINSWFKIAANKDLKDKVLFKSDEEFAYFVDNTKWFRISGQKDQHMRWRLVNIEFTPRFVSDYDVETTSSEDGRVSGNLGAAAIGGIIAGTAGAVAGASMGRKTQGTIISHSLNSAQMREIPATAILTIEDQTGRKTKIADKWYEEDITILKTNYLVDEPLKEESKSIVNEIKKLQSLLDEGIITEKEFIEGKHKILKI